MSASAFGRLNKGGLLALFLSCALVIGSAWLTATVAAESLLLDITSAAAGFEQRTNRPIVTIRLSEVSKGAFVKFTADRVGHSMQLRVDGQVVVKSVVREPLNVGTFQISGLSVDETRDIANRLASNYGRIEVEFVSD